MARCLTKKREWERAWRAANPGRRVERRRADRYEDYRWARDAGMTFENTARMLGLQPASLERWLKRTGLEKV